MHTEVFTATDDDAAPQGDPRSALAPALTDAQIHDRIVAAVLDQRLAPGTRLGEDRLGRIFNVSRTRIRQVLIRLAGEQLVTLAMNRGARVAQPTPDEAREVFAVRRLIEPALLAGFIARAGAAERAGLGHWIDAEESARARGDARAAIRAAGLFHVYVAEHAGNATLLRLLRELTSRTALVLMSYGPPHIAEPAAPRSAARPASGRYAGCECTEHRALHAAVVLGDAHAAARLMDAHLMRLESELVFTREPAPAPELDELLAASRPAPLA